MQSAALKDHSILFSTFKKENQNWELTDQCLSLRFFSVQHLYLEVPGRLQPSLIYNSLHTDQKNKMCAKSSGGNQMLHMSELANQHHICCWSAFHEWPNTQAAIYHHEQAVKRLQSGEVLKLPLAVSLYWPFQNLLQLELSPTFYKLKPEGALLFATQLHQDYVF